MNNCRYCSNILTPKKEENYIQINKIDISIRNNKEYSVDIGEENINFCGFYCLVRFLEKEYSERK